MALSSSQGALAAESHLYQVTPSWDSFHAMTEPGGSIKVWPFGPNLGQPDGQYLPQSFPWEVSNLQGGPVVPCVLLRPDSLLLSQVLIPNVHLILQAPNLRVCFQSV